VTTDTSDVNKTFPFTNLCDGIDLIIDILDYIYLSWKRSELHLFVQVFR
jgi:hypothetical protein